MYDISLAKKCSVLLIVVSYLFEFLIALGILENV